MKLTELKVTNEQLKNERYNISIRSTSLIINAFISNNFTLINNVI